MKNITDHPEIESLARELLKTVAGILPESERSIFRLESSAFGSSYGIHMYDQEGYDKLKLEHKGKWSPAMVGYDAVKP